MVPQVLTPYHGVTTVVYSWCYHGVTTSGTLMVLPRGDYRGTMVLTERVPEYREYRGAMALTPYHGVSTRGARDALHGVGLVSPRGSLSKLMMNSSKLMYSVN
jgi:hypothetical protein